jgi:hypothetical protein
LFFRREITRQPAVGATAVGKTTPAKASEGGDVLKNKTIKTNTYMILESNQPCLLLLLSLVALTIRSRKAIEI